MQKGILAFVICAILISTVAGTSVVSAKDASQSSMRQYDIISFKANGVVVGKFTVDMKTGHYIVNANYGKGDIKLISKQQYAGMHGLMRAINPKSTPNEVWFYQIRVVFNDGGNAHGEGYVTDNIAPPKQEVPSYVEMLHGQAILDWLNVYGAGATFNPIYYAE